MKKSYTHLWVFGEEEAGGKTGPDTLHPSSFAQPAAHGYALKIEVVCRRAL